MFIQTNFLGTKIARQEYNTIEYLIVAGGGAGGSGCGGGGGAGGFISSSVDLSTLSGIATASFTFQLELEVVETV